jgi:ABC-type nitrate/sulfonate/bicarbonate transport system permease component
MKSAYAGIVIAALLGVIVSALISFVGRVATPWADEERGGGRA